MFQRDIQRIFQRSTPLYPSYLSTWYQAYLSTQQQAYVSTLRSSISSVCCNAIFSVSFNAVSHYIYMNDKYQALQALLNQSWPLTVQILAAKYHGFTPSMYPALSTHSLVSSHQVHGLLNLLLFPSWFLIVFVWLFTVSTHFTTASMFNFVTVMIQFQFKFVHDVWRCWRYTLYLIHIIIQCNLIVIQC